MTMLGYIDHVTPQYLLILTWLLANPFSRLNKHCEQTSAPSEHRPFKGLRPNSATTTDSATDKVALPFHTRTT